MKEDTKTTRKQGQRSTDQGIRWKVVVDPDGAFRGGLFTWEQIKHGGFDNGTVFENAVTGERLKWVCNHDGKFGRLVEVGEEDFAGGVS